MKPFLSAGVCLILAFSLAGCSHPPKNSTIGAATGAVVGGVAGGLIGHGNPAGIAVGAVAGGVGGYYIGKSTEK